MPNPEDSLNDKDDQVKEDILAIEYTNPVDKNRPFHGKLNEGGILKNKGVKNDFTKSQFCIK